MSNILTRLISGRSLRPEKRSTALISIANSLGVIASALKIIVLKEYGADLDQPLTRADREREVFEPIYPDNEREAINEEVERIKREQAEWSTSGELRTGRGPAVRILGGLTPASAAGGSEDLTPEEREFLAELGSEEQQ